MQKFKITIEEVLAKEVEVEAKNVSDAIDIVKKQYRNGDVVLSADDFVDVDFLIEEKHAPLNFL
jgi:hypothetical protein